MLNRNTGKSLLRKEQIPLAKGIHPYLLVFITAF